MLVGQAGLVCPNGHGRIEREGFEEMQREHPERRIEH